MGAWGGGLAGSGADSDMLRMHAKRLDQFLEEDMDADKATVTFLIINNAVRYTALICGAAVHVLVVISHDFFAFRTRCASAASTSAPSRQLKRRKK